MPIKIMLDPGHGQGREFNRGSVIGNEVTTTLSNVKGRFLPMMAKDETSTANNGSS